MLLSSFAKTRQRLGAALLSLLLITTAQADTDEIVYFHTDANGSPTAAFNEAGEVCWTETYSPYGEKLDNEDSLPTAEGCGLLSPNDVGYTGHVQDGSGLVYAQQRYYDPVIGRFMSTDPVMPNAGDPRYFGRYHYGANNPYRYTDPTGEGLWDAITETVTQIGEGVFGLGDGEYNSDAIGDALASGYNGDQGALGIASTAAEDILTVLSFGEYAALRGALTAGRGAVSVSTAEASAVNNLTKSQQKSIRSLEKRIIEHRKKINDFKASPTVRPGMENMPADAIARQQASRISHLEKEIATFTSNVDKIRSGRLP